MGSGEIAVFVEPISHHFLEDKLFDPHRNAGSYYEPYGLVRDLFAERGIPVHTADFLRRGFDVRAVNVYFSIANLAHYAPLIERDDVVLSALFHTEAPIVQPSVYRGTARAARHFRRVYSFSTSSALASYGCGGVTLERSMIPEPRDRPYDELWSRDDRSFMAIVMHNRLPVRNDRELYTERLRAIEFFSRTGEIDLYGVGWDDPPMRVGERRIPLPGRVRSTAIRVRKKLPFASRHPLEDVVRRVYRGPVESKYEALSRYTFSITYENMMLDGWINEKLFDAMLAGTVPIYLGAPDIAAWVPRDCFIDQREFRDYAELREFLHSLGPAELKRYRENARDYLASERFGPFRKETFAQKFVDAVETDLNISLDGIAAG